MRAAGVLYRCPQSTDGPPTGRCLIVVTPDAQRTMATYLGASELLGPHDVDGDLVAAAQVTFLEGYLFDKPEARAAYWKASRVAHASGPARAAARSALLDAMPAMVTGSDVTTGMAVLAANGIKI